MDVLEASNTVKMFREQQETCVTTPHPISRFHGLFFFFFFYPQHLIYFDWASVFKSVIVAFPVFCFVL